MIMQLLKLPSTIPRLVLNACLTVLLLSLVLWSVGILRVHTLQESLTAPFHWESNDSSRYSSKLDPTDRRCHAVSNAPDVAVIVKTGANIIYDKLPIQLLATLRCAKDPLIFSDLAQSMGPYLVYDALENVSSILKDSPEFEYYHKLQEYDKFGQDIRELRVDPAPGWKLDKYKFIPMLEKTWTMRPHHDWYVFIEDDTYLIWTNLMLWLQQYDPNGLHYFGGQASFNGEFFAHGGSGIVVSRGAMSKVLDNDPEISARYEKIVQHETYGDRVLTRAFQEKNVPLGLYRPMLQGEPPSTMRFGPGLHVGERYWCQPVVSMHHVVPGDVDAIWRYEQQRQDLSRPILFADMYQQFMMGLLPRKSDDLEDWYNKAEDAHIQAPGKEENGRRLLPPPPPPVNGEVTLLQQEAYQSYEKCAAACAEYPRCMQYAYDFLEKRCSYSWSYRLGKKYQPTSDGKRYKSGWIQSRINSDIEANSCVTPLWKGFYTADAP